MLQRKRMLVFLLLGVFLLSIAMSGCSREQEIKATVNDAYPHTLEQLVSMQGCDISDVQCIDYCPRGFSSQSFQYEKENELAWWIDRLDQGYESITEDAFKTICDFKSLAYLYLNFEQETILFYITPDGYFVMEWNGSYYLSENGGTGVPIFATNFPIKQPDKHQFEFWIWKTAWGFRLQAVMVMGFLPGCGR